MKNLLLFFSMALGMITMSCNQKHPCYSESLYSSAQAMDCTMDCPGVCGCDGKFYCNPCIAAQSGIAVDTTITGCH